MVVYVTTTSGTKAAIPHHVPFLTIFGTRPISFRPSALSQKFIDLYFTPRMFLAMYTPVELTEHWEELREEVDKLWQEQKDTVEWWYVDSRTSTMHNPATEREGTGEESNEQNSETHKSDEETTPDEKSAT
ncbi:hypothetical protein HYFRA_00013791 [Hymenoscyphus fraxineus]|uniref:Uncharacterized protein n=1 Tax=Hymenoscyphus fraxineus TaxID=746836 RepID=A0A9N9L6K8_9HELO|nr:hypothetical protein HYFRA_00013791 [Hymenoscyphus fraxineus]